MSLRPCFVSGLLAFCAAVSTGAELERLSLLAVEPRSKEATGTAIEITAAAVKVDRQGLLVRTSVELTLVSKRERRVEALMRLPIREGNTVSGFRWELPDGTIREGVGVGKSLGSRAYESVVSRSIDPGLVEWENDGLLKVHMFPLLQDAPKRVAFEITGLLELEEGAWIYRLPLRFAKPGGWESEPALDPDDVAALLFREEFAEGQPLVSFCERAGERFFAGAVHCDVGESLLEIERGVLLAWDVSGSARGRDLDRELAVLGALLARTDCRIDLVPFSVTEHERRSFDIVGGDLSALRKSLESLDCYGGTNFAAVDLAAEEADLVIVSSDGAELLGEVGAAQPGVPLVLIDSVSAKASATGHGVARSLGGDYLHIGQQIDPAVIARSIRRRGVLIRGASSGGTVAEDLRWAEVGDGWFWVSGRLAGAGEKLTFDLGADHAPLEVGLAEDDGRSFVAWAASGWPGHCETWRQRGRWSAIAQEAGVVTPDASLIVLERRWDYDRWGIKLAPDMVDTPRAPVAVAELEAAEASNRGTVLPSFKNFLAWHSAPAEHVAKYAGRGRGIPEYGEQTDGWGWRSDRGWEADFGMDSAETSKVDGYLRSLRLGLASEREELNGALLQMSSELADAEPGEERQRLLQKREEIVRKLRAVADDRLFLEWNKMPWREREKLGVAVPTDAEIGKILDLMSMYGEELRRSGPGPFGPQSSFPAGGGMAMGGSGGAVDDPFSSGGDLGGGSGAMPADNGANDGAPIGAAPDLEQTGAGPDGGGLGQLEGRAWSAAFAKAAAGGKLELSWYRAVADDLAGRGERALAVRVLTEVVERWPYDLARMRVVGWQLLQIGAVEEAVAVFERAANVPVGDQVAKRDLALAIAEAGRHGEAAVMLDEVARSSAMPEGWSGRMCALLEMNRELQIQGGELPDRIHEESVQTTPMDLRIVLDWNREDRDLDLVVIDPNYERLSAWRPASPEGAVVPQGSARLGPEEFWSKEGLPGTYSIRIVNRTRRWQRGAGHTVARVRAFTRWSSGDESVETWLVTVPDDVWEVEVGDVVFEE